MIRLLATLALALSINSTAMAEFIVDTDSNPDGPPYGFTIAQYFGAAFNVADPVTVTSVEGFFNIRKGGKVHFAIHADGGYVPGSVIYSTSMLFTGSELDSYNQWIGISGLDWALSEGNYWVSFRPESSVYGTMPGNAPNPLDWYSVTDAIPWAAYQWGNITQHARESIDIGVRIGAVPEPASIALGAVALIGLLAFRRARLA